MTVGCCLCGKLQYEVQPPLGAVVHCHCSRCRRHHGAPFASWMAVSNQRFRWIAGEEEVQHYAETGRDGAPRGRCRSFCPHCGSVAPVRQGAHVLLPAGNLMGELGELLGCHQWVRDKAPWHQIADEWPQHNGGRDGEDSGWPLGEVAAKGDSPEGTHGSCLCGDVSFVVKGQPSRWLQCHCSRCRRGRSAVHGSNLFYLRAQFEWLAGVAGARVNSGAVEARVISYVPPEAKRFQVSFCSRCGGGTPVVRDGVPFVLVPAGLLLSDPGVRPEAHIHMSSKAGWYTPVDPLPQWPELPE